MIAIQIFLYIYDGEYRQDCLDFDIVHYSSVVSGYILSAYET